MVLAILFIVLGLVLLVVGGEALVKGALRFAQRLRISPTIIGLTVVAAGTSMPEMVVSVGASLKGSGGIALGNVVGSNLFNITAILGIAALIRPLAIKGNTVRMEWPVMMLASFLLLLLARDGVIDRLEGGFFAISLVIFTLYAIHVARRSATPEEREEFSNSASPPTANQRPLWVSALFVIGGIAALSGGATLLIEGAVTVAESLGVSETVIGLTIIAAGTSLPELAASCMASLRGNSDIAVANVIGSNIFNVLGICGVAALVHPLDVSPQLLASDMWWMLGATLLLLPLMRSGMTVSRFEGGVLLIGFAGYIVLLLV